eukprot:TRINITY_DN34861_c0_g1_i1.p1 TRINITY_DN34861_c0_g1~~TRINITY_DN34861_c0_g1_i1.p1  ORF type:complete len:360 (-),score=76.30 TRINITY_DN34861_c0_g1_i1:108-1187(-)
MSAVPLTLTIPADVRSVIKRVKAYGESDIDVIRRSVDWLEAFSILAQVADTDDIRLNYQEFRKAGIACLQMRDVDWKDDKVVAVCKAAFCDQTDTDMQRAFEYFDTDGSGTLDKTELQDALPLIGENIPQEQIDDLFRLVDADGTGKVSIDEFGTLMRGLNPKTGDGGPFSAFRKIGTVGLENVGETTMTAAVGAVGLLSGVGSTFSALGAAWQADLSGLGPVEMRKAGAVINNMKAAGYPDEKAHTIVKALFHTDSDECLQKAFEFYDADGGGSMDMAEFREALPLMGEVVPQDMVDEAFKKVDKDGSGQLDFEEFCLLIRLMNPPPTIREDAGDEGAGAGAGGYVTSAMSWWNREGD